MQFAVRTTPMKTLKYSSIPSRSQWLKDSSVTLAIRSKDTVLLHIDWLLERYNVRYAERNFALCAVILSDLFLALNLWVKLYHQKSPAVDPGRYPAIIALFEKSVELLKLWIGCPSSELFKNLVAMFGNELTEGGNKIDNVQLYTRNLTAMERKLSRLHFNGGRAYQYPWWKVSQGTPGLQLRLAESVRAYADILRSGDATSQNFGPFICTLEREFFMFLHDTGDFGRQNGIYHSSYTAGSPVMGAGTMLIERGVVKAIRADSGHYHPGDCNMVAVLQALGMYGVNLSKVNLFSWNRAKPLGSALDFLRSKMSWKNFLDHRDDQFATYPDRHVRSTHPGAPVQPKEEVWVNYG